MNKKKRRDNQAHLDKSRHTHRRSFPTSKSHTYKDTHTHKRSHLAIMTLPHNSAGVGVHNAGERRLCREKMINQTFCRRWGGWLMVIYLPQIKQNVVYQRLCREKMINQTFYRREERQLYLPILQKRKYHDLNDCYIGEEKTK